MMNTLRSYHLSDYQEIAYWFKAREMNVPSMSDLPLTGKIVPGIAAGFLLKTDTKCAVIDFMITNKDARPMARGRAVDAIARSLILKAKSLGFKRVRCDSQIDTIKKKALSLGFKSSGDHTVFCKEI